MPTEDRFYLCLTVSGNHADVTTIVSHLQQLDHRFSPEFAVSGNSYGNIGCCLTFHVPYLGDNVAGQLNLYSALPVLDRGSHQDHRDRFLDGAAADMRQKRALERREQLAALRRRRNKK